MDSSFRPRHEMKFLIPFQSVAAVRDYASSFCIPDPMSKGNPPSYKVTTLQLDSPDLSLHFAKDRELKNRFKLRVRSYGDANGDCPAFIEIKRKFDNIVSKSRVKLSRKTYVEDLALSLTQGKSPKLSCESDRDTFLEFMRLCRAIDAGPVLRIRYDRECWVGLKDSSVRITFDRNLEYQSASDFNIFNERAPWLKAETSKKVEGTSPIILELKSGLQIPDWVIGMIRYFRLTRTGFCKYSEAVNLESSFKGRSQFSMTGFRGNIRNCS